MHNPLPSTLTGMRFQVEVTFDDDYQLSDVILTYPDPRHPRLAAVEEELRRGLRHVLADMADDILAEVGVEAYAGRRTIEDIERQLRSE